MMYVYFELFLFILFQYIYSINGTTSSSSSSIIQLYPFDNSTYGTCMESYSPIINTLTLANYYGINVFREQSENAQMKNIYGGYRPYTHDILLYNAPTLDNFNEKHYRTLKHELVHALQHCKGKRMDFIPLLHDTSLVICLARKKINLPFIKSFYPVEDILIEIDAYCLENVISYANISTLLNKYCDFSVK